MPADLSNELTLAVTGHRPTRILLDRKNAYDESVFSRLVDLAEAALVKYRPSRILTGMALGWDQAIAEAALRLEIPYYAYIPFVGQENLWPEASRERYARLLEGAVGTKVCAPGRYAAWKMQHRNRLLVDHSQMLLALYDGTPKGGTYDALVYAQRKRTKIVNVWPSWTKFGALVEATV